MTKITFPLLKASMVKRPEKSQYGRTVTLRTFELNDMEMRFMPPIKG